VPIYEFYCGRCHTIFNFFSRKIDTETRPACPRCGRPDLERCISRVAAPRGGREPAGADEGVGDLDDARMEQAMEELARETEGVDEDDPRQMARMMRKLSQTAGVPLDERMEESLRRMEAGEDPEKIEEEMGDLLGEGEEPDAEGRAETAPRRPARRRAAPEVDETLYDM
jgi:putative FmdB family regulatory protein